MRPFRIARLVLVLLAACSSDRGRGRAPVVPTTCGNGVIDSGEACDGTLLGNSSCVALGLGDGVLVCAKNCKSVDRSACGAPVTCGNGILDAVELCDGTQLGTATCESTGHGTGQLGCLANCNSYDASGCVAATPRCGDGRAEGAEVCDGADLGGATCEALGYTGGTLACATDCASRVTDGCTGTCTPACGARVCGPDPMCGMSCGTCSTGTCNADGACEGGTGGAPVIISFTTNVTTYRAGSLVFSAIVTDPDGVDDLIGGQLTSPSGGTYGAFVTAAQEGAYSLTLDRRALDQVDPLMGPPTGVQRTFRAEFFDVAGHRIAQEVTITVRCPADGESMCGATCLNLDADEFNCGACGRNCETAIPSGIPVEGDSMCAGGLCIAYAYGQASGSCQSVCTGLGATCTMDPSRPSFPYGNRYYDCDAAQPVTSCTDPNPQNVIIDTLTCSLLELSCVCGF